MRALLSFRDVPYLGIFASVTEELAVIPPDIPLLQREELCRTMGVEPVVTTINESLLVGSQCRSNSSGFVVSGLAMQTEINVLEQKGKVYTLPPPLSAAGNLLLVNDSAGLVHPGVSDETINMVERTLGVNIHRGTIAGLKTVGMAGVATNKGVLVHPRVTDRELKHLEKVFELPVEIGTVNFGSPLVGAALLANTRGYAVGALTSGPEIGRIDTGLGFI
jgi:translation initiation factor 6